MPNLNQEPLIKFFKTYLHARALFDQLYDIKKKKLREETLIKKENLEGFDALAKIFRETAACIDLVDYKLKSIKKLDELLNTSVQDIPGKQLKYLIDTISYCDRNEFYCIRQQFYELFAGFMVGYQITLKKSYALPEFRKRNYGIISDLFNLFDILHIILTVISDARRSLRLSMLFPNIANTLPERYNTKRLFRGGKKVGLKIVYFNEEQPDEAIKNLLDEVFKENTTIRQALSNIKKVSKNTEKLVSATTLAFGNRLMEQLLGSAFRTNCTIYVKKYSGMVKNTSAWFLPKFIQKRIFSGHECTIEFRPDQKDLRMFITPEFLSSANISDISSAILHEITHNLDKKLNTLAVWPDIVRREGIAVFSEANDDPQKILEFHLDPFLKLAKPYDSLSDKLEGNEPYTAGLLIMLGLLDARIRKKETEWERSDRAIREFNLAGGAPHFDIHNPNYYRYLLRNYQEEAHILLKIAMQLKTKAFFEYYFDQVGIPWFFTKKLCMELARELNSKKIMDALKQKQAA